MTLWQNVWRRGLAPQFSDKGLEALRDALVKDDPTLIQKCTLTPPPGEMFGGDPVEAACAIGYCGWKEGRELVEEVEGYFIRICLEAEQLLDDPPACRHFITWFDNTPRSEMRQQLLEEVNRTLEERRWANTPSTRSLEATDCTAVTT